MQSRFAVISTVIAIDYDGCMTYDMKLATRSDSVRVGFDAAPDTAKRIVDRLWLEIPMKKEHSVFERHSEPYRSGASEDTSFSFTPISWFGDDNRGLEVCFESNENWNPYDENSAMEIFSDDKTQTFRVRFLDSQPKLWEREAGGSDRGIYVTPINFSFSLTATPIKPCDEAWLLREHIIHVDSFDRIETEYLKYFTSKTSDTDDTIVLDRLMEKGVTTLTIHQKWNRVQGWWKLGRYDSERIHKLIDEAHKRGIKIQKDLMV